MSKKSFIEFEKPRRTMEYVVIVREIEANQNWGNCQATMKKRTCNAEADYQCAICNCWTCYKHESRERGFKMICQNCEKLSKAEQEAVVEFREKMNQG